MTETSRRLFLACNPGESLRDELWRVGRFLHRENGGRQVPRENIHLTLLFLGQVDAADETALRERCAGIDFQPFELQLDRLGLWPRAGVAWIGTAQTPAPLGTLVAALREAASDIGLAVERRPYRAHVTLLRKAHGYVSKPVRPLAWTVDHFALVESVMGDEGVQYQIRERFPRAAAPETTKLSAGPAAVE